MVKGRFLRTNDMALIRWEPMADIERVFGDMLPGFGGGTSMGWDTAVDVYERDNNIMAEMHLSGVDPSKLDVSVKDNALHVSGSREETKEEKGKHYYRKEIVRGAFSRVIPLPAVVDDMRAQAKYRDGVLMIALPKSEQQQADKKRIPVQAEQQVA